MKPLLVTLLLCLFAVTASADAIVIPFSGSGASGTIAPGEPWAVNAATLQTWGSPGSGLGLLLWPGAPTPGDITDFTITFTGLGTTTISPTSLATSAQDCGGLDTGGTVFCSNGSGNLVQWTPVLGNGNDTITFTAPSGSALFGGNDYFVNIFFSGPDGGTVTFTGGWSSPVPEPGSLVSAGIGIALLGTIIWFKRISKNSFSL